MLTLAPTDILLPLGLGLIGFIEPCTIGAHLLFLRGQRQRAPQARVSAMATFLLSRLLVMGGFGGAIVVAGQKLIGVQTGAWLIFGAIYLAMGAAFWGGHSAPVRRHIRLSPEAWKTASNPVLQGAAFGLNIPACAAPILFGLIGPAIASPSALTGFWMMALFALGLSAPLIPLSLLPQLAAPLDRFGDRMRRRRWLVGLVFVTLGLWSLWFGLAVDPADWSGR